MTLHRHGCTNLLTGATAFIAVFSLCRPHTAAPVFLMHFYHGEETPLLMLFSGSFFFFTPKEESKLLNMVCPCVIWLPSIFLISPSISCLCFLQLQKYFFSSADAPCTLFSVGIPSLSPLLCTLSPPSLFFLVTPYLIFQFLFIASRKLSPIFPLTPGRSELYFYGVLPGYTEFAQW